ncbi:type VII secretion-associated protein [Mycolicibacterium chitae]|uniref:type VII secretion-associated protein n=1 Tax=Mycolicibacterium chitae TaxID=1792 RepID=UPI0021F2EF17|nr:type VII secretion-associated protein [Mycolicibacterium chitae]MCV7105772.1 type VII secretion-associated protein [Mycolicibacterium chitae]
MRRRRWLSWRAGSAPPSRTAGRCAASPTDPDRRGWRWPPRRVTDGPGSARLEVAAPGEPAAVLHLTQAAVPGGDLPAVAATLHAALREQPPGVFVDFNPTDRRAQRPAITYREIRPGAEIRWTVLVDDGIRIGIGCVGPPELSAVCDAAIGSAHRIR